MQTIINSIAVAALLGVVLLLFASSALLRLVRELQAGLVELRAGGTGSTKPAMTFSEFASDDGRPTYVAVVDARCPACWERAQELADLSATYRGGHLAALIKDAECAEWFRGTAVRVVTDAVLLGRVGVGVTPMMIKYDDRGTEIRRQVIGAREDLTRLLDLPLVDVSAARLIHEHP